MPKNYIVYDEFDNELGRYSDKSTADFKVRNHPGSRLQYEPQTDEQLQVSQQTIEINKTTQVPKVDKKANKHRLELINSKSRIENLKSYTIFINFLFGLIAIGYTVFLIDQNNQLSRMIGMGDPFSGNLLIIIGCIVVLFSIYIGHQFEMMILDFFDQKNELYQKEYTEQMTAGIK